MNPPATPSATNCLECNAPLSPAETQGLCARCLLKMGLASQLGENSVTDAGTRKLVPPPMFPFNFGNYRMLRLLGRGGMGAVYEADDLESGRRVALKVLGHSLDSADTRKRFLREGRLAASINHPNSVYVYGTEEIDGTPVITMELVPGGTLHERVKEGGAMPVGEAVDAVLQLIRGLEAAHAAGILHRDIKPSNCFLEPGGVVKIGDFGLSISTLSRGDSALTMAGSVLGTPEFASPEQLRGEALDLRSDIYSVGMTLYYLLTGTTPFPSGNLVQLLATVLDKPAPSPRTFRPEIPERLARIILRCLAKQSGDRYRDYDELRQALLPFCSTAPTPATLALRFAAGFVDNLLLSVVNLITSTTLFGGLGAMVDGRYLHTLQGLWYSLWVLGFQLAYFAIGEGVWGATPGKALLGLRVGVLNRSTPGVPRGLARAALYLVANAFLLLWVRAEANPMQINVWSAGVGIVCSLYPMLLAVTARRRNGYATIIDLLTKTRVFQKAAYEAREAVPQVEELAAASDTTAVVGPYHVMTTLEADAAGELILGYDARLMRRVWIRKLPAGTAPLPPERRSTARPGRLRWLQGRRDGTADWDAYEAPPGAPLLALLSAPQPWKRVRHWLLDLANECAAAAEDGSLPMELSLERVWIGASGGAKLLDFRAPGTTATAEPLPGAESAAFLNQLAISALEGRIASAQEARTSELRVPVAVRARALLRDLRSATDLRAVVDQLRTLAQQLPAVSLRRRFGLVAGCVIPSVMIAGITMVGALAFMSWRQKDPDVIGLQRALLALERMHKNHYPATIDPAVGVGPLETFIAGRYGSVMSDPNRWQSPFAMAVVTPAQRRMASEIVSRLGQPSEDAMMTARSKLGRAIDVHGELEFTLVHHLMPGEEEKIMLCVMSIGGFLWAALLSLGAAALCRGGLLMRALGIAVVTREGNDATRLRMLWRAVVAWSWMPLGVVMAAMLAPLVGFGAGFAVAITLVAAVAAWSAIMPSRTLQDRAAGTWLVPR